MQINNLINQKIQEKENEAKLAKLELELLKREQKEVTTKKGIEKWLGYEFESSSGLTEEFATFARELKNHLKKELQNNFELVGILRGHFELSGFVKNKNTGKYAYFSMSDVRYFNNEWYEHILVREAKHDKDYTGGSNWFTGMKELPTSLLKLTA